MKILTCYGVLLLLQMNNCFKQEDFRKCSQTGFCKRARSRAEDVLGKQKKQEFEWAIKDDVIKPRKKESSIYDFELVGKRNDNKSGSTLLKAELSILEDGGIIRVRIDEPGKGRYSIPSKDVISADLELYENQQEQIRIVYPEKKGTCSFIYAQFMVSIQYRPFKMWIFENGKERFILNDFGLFHVESNIDNDLFDEEDVEELALPGQRQHLSEDSWSDEVIAKPAPNPVDVDRQFRNFKDSLPKGRQSLSADILFPRIANVYGLPEHASSFNLQESFRMLGRNFTVLHEPYRLYNLDVFEYELDSPAALYGSVPFLMGVDRSEDALRTVGVLWNNPSETWVDIGLNPKNGIDKLAHFSSESGQLDLFFFIGSKPKDLSTKLAQVCGYPAMPPQFSLGYHQCRWNYKSEDDLLSVNQYFDDYGIPVDVLWLDIEHTDDKRYFTWDQQQFPNPIEMQKKIGESQRHLVNIVDPHIKVDQGYAVYLELASSKKYAVLNAKREMFEGSCWPGNSVWADFANPEARSWWSSLFKLSKYPGSTNILHIWNDMNEPSVFSGPEITMPKDNLHLGGTVEHRDLHNLYGQYMHRATFEGLKTARDGKRPFVLSRAFYAGTQKFGAVWTGDNAASWDHLAASVPMLLSLAVSGISFAGADVGGFFGNPTPELLVRWYQTGALQPFFRAHAHIDSKRREPWLFPEPCLTHIRSAIRLRYQLLPYIYTLAYEAYITGVPMMRPMMMEFPEEDKLAKLDDQYMFGSALLHKPVTDPDDRTVSVLLPSSKQWYDFFTLEKVESDGRQRYAMDIDLETIPLFVAGGSIVPLKMRPRRSSLAMYTDPFTLLIALDQNEMATGTLYIDDGESYDFDQGAAIFRRLDYADERLVCKPADSFVYGKLQLSPKFNVKIEAIIITGFSHAKGLPKSAKVGGRSLKLQHDSNSTLQIRMPPVSLNDTWEISFLRN